MNRDLRFFFHHEKEIRALTITSSLPGLFTLGKARFDHWQYHRFGDRPAFPTTIIDSTIREKLTKANCRPNPPCETDLEVEYLENAREWQLKNRPRPGSPPIPPSRLAMMHRGKEIVVRTPPGEGGTPGFRWTVQRITPPRG